MFYICMCRYMELRSLNHGSTKYYSIGMQCIASFPPFNMGDTLEMMYHSPETDHSRIGIEDWDDLRIITPITETTFNINSTELVTGTIKVTVLSIASQLVTGRTM